MTTTTNTTNTHTTITKRLGNPATLRNAAAPIRQAYAVAQQSGITETILHLVHLRVSQINGCSYCVHAGVASARSSGESDDRLFAVAAWREAPFFTEAERAALQLAEAETRIADQPDPVSDPIWSEAERHFDEEQLAGLVLAIGIINLFNRMNVTLRKPANESH